ncbi:hypothetical protein IWQ56_003762 [Coemansia nantahalensis]|nr:hypothetical protein IWQ56_003762 [Coemansia nantahalensis]
MGVPPEFEPAHGPRLTHRLSASAQNRPADCESEGEGSPLSWQSSNASAQSSPKPAPASAAQLHWLPPNGSGAQPMAPPPPQAASAAKQRQCRCSQCDPNFYTMPMHLLFAGQVEYVCRDCQHSTSDYYEVQQHEAKSGHRRWYNYPQ